MARTVVQDHHIIPLDFSNNRVVILLGGLFDINAPTNGIYLPADTELARTMGLSPHNGGPLDSYTNGIRDFLNELGESADFTAAPAPRRP
ncbi:AHH domain-containing protein [Bradyrhizobium sp.]|uniref:AHH domain-containing protein n=1 Tax=Bradyrhizobium sp. TaxID=376 RepID=UPI0040382183